MLELGGIRAFCDLGLELLEHAALEGVRRVRGIADAEGGAADRKAVRLGGVAGCFRCDGLAGAQRVRGATGGQRLSEARFQARRERGDGSARLGGVRLAITGHQDTLFTDAGRALFRNCTISGSVDFIFGGATALFDRCEIVSRFRPLMQRNHGFVSAPCTPETSAFGLVFLDCRLTREEQVPPASVVLGRSWRPTRTFADGRYGDPQARGASAFLRCWMDDHISADGWDEMAYTDKTGARVFLQPSQARFREYASTGPGAFENRRRPWMAQTEAETFTPARILGDWRPA